MSQRERSKNGRFATSVKENVEEAFNLATVVCRLLPVLLVVLFALNHFKAWKILKNYGNFIMNVGNPDCQVVCRNEVIDIE